MSKEYDDQKTKKPTSTHTQMNIKQNVGQHELQQKP